MKIARVLCWFGRHDWAFKVAFVEPPDYDAPVGMHYGSTHYTGECRRCGDRNLFRGPYRAELEIENVGVKNSDGELMKRGK